MAIGGLVDDDLVDDDLVTKLETTGATSLKRWCNAPYGILRDAGLSQEQISEVDRLLDVTTHEDNMRTRRHVRCLRRGLCDTLVLHWWCRCPVAERGAAHGVRRKDLHAQGMVWRAVQRPLRSPLTRADQSDRSPPRRDDTRGQHAYVLTHTCALPAFGPV